MALLLPAMARGSSWRVEAESAVSIESAESSTASSAPRSARTADASAGSVLVVQGFGPDRESGGIAITFPQSGPYWIWVRYRCAANEQHFSFYALMRDEVGEGIAVKQMDLVPRLPTERPYLAKAALGTDRIAEDNWTWQAMPVVIERPLEATLHFGSFYHGGNASSVHVDCAIVTDEEGFTPITGDWRKFTPPPKRNVGTATRADESDQMMPASGFPMNSSFFAGISDRARQWKAGLSYGAAMYFDHARFISLGFNRTHGQGGSRSYGIWMMRPADVFASMDAPAAAKYPSPAGRFVNSQRQVGTNWSLSFEPLFDGLFERTRATLNSQLKDPSIESWRIVSEIGGQMDYSEPARQAFGRWLSRKYESIEQLNQHWKTSYATFSEVEPGTDPSQGQACWLEFRRFSGEVFAHAIQRQAEAVRKADPSGRELTQQLSNVNLLCPQFMAMWPLDWETFIDIALKDIDCVGWDAYSADDFQGCEIDLAHSLAQGRRLLNEEWNVHAADPRIAARTLWTMIGKGLRGVHCYQWQQGTFDDSYPKWALLNGDFTPRAKLGAMADIAHEVHRLEPLLTSARRVESTKPVAMYYSTMDLALAKPLASPWGESVDSPYHVYATLRGAGYAVRWITPLQIERGELAGVSAVVMVDAQHVPTSAARALATWIHDDGGAVIADGWPGALDEYGQAQNDLAGVFGVRAKSSPAAAAAATTDRPPATQPGGLALEQSTQGYGEVTINALRGDDLPSTVGEIWQQWDSTHPVAKSMGNYTLSGYGLKRVVCFAGQVVGMTFGGDPGIVINQYGRGQAMYVALMLGSLYEGAATRYEWDSSHSGMAYMRLLDEFLRFAGAEPAAAVQGLELPVRSKLRIESPLVDDKGNILIAMSSINDQPLCGFEMRIPWPDDTPVPHQVFFIHQGCRRMDPVKFDIRNRTLTATIPAFDTHAAIVALKDSDPLVGLKFAGPDRGPAGLMMVQPGDELSLTATVHNPSDSTVAAGEVKLWAPRGWFIDAPNKPCPAIAPWGEAALTFKIRAPSIGGEARLRPIVVKHIAQNKTSTPATELVWWNRAANSPF